VTEGAVSVSCMRIPPALLSILGVWKGKEDVAYWKSADHRAARGEGGAW
jgi:hypothetical protein